MNTYHLDRDISDYCKNIYKLLDCSSSVKKKFTSEIRCNIQEYIDENPQAKITDIINHFGSPEDISSSYLATLEEGDMNKKISKAKFIKRLSVLIGLIVIVLFVSLYFYIVNYNKGQTNGVWEVGTGEGQTVSTISK